MTFSAPMSNFRTFQVLKNEKSNFRTFQDQWEPCFAFFDSNLAVNYVAFGSDHQKLVGNPMVSMMSPEHPLHVCQLLHFCQLLSKPRIDLELEYIFGKPMKHTLCLKKTS